MRTDGPVVVALDGSEHSAHTLEWGVAEAVRRRARVLLVRILGDPWQVSAWTWYPVVGDSDLEADATEYLARQCALVRAGHPGLRVDARVLRGPVVPRLNDLSGDAQLVVIGAGTRHGRARTGVVDAHVAAHARCPVAVVRTDPENPTPPTAPVMVGVDGSPASLVAASAAAYEAWMRGRPLVVVHARATRGSVAPLADADQLDPTHKAAQVVAEMLRENNPGLAVDLALVDDDPVDALTGLASCAALLVVGSRGLGGFRGMLLGSVSAAVVREATCPVLVVHDEAGVAASGRGNRPLQMSAAAHESSHV
jgi:nucleotide-binding universal stress UspA family protein